MPWFARFALALLLIGTLASLPAAASVMKSEIPGAHYKANTAAQVDLTRARSRIQQGKFGAAAEALHAAAAKDSLAGETFDLMGQLHLRQGEYRRAFDSFQHAAVLAPEMAPVWNRLAQVALIQLGFEQEGMLALRYCQTADSTFAASYYTQFVYHWARCEFQEASDAITLARRHEQDESHSLVWYSAQLGMDLTKGDYANTADALRAHLAQADNDYSARMSLAQAERGLGKPLQARNDIYLLLGVDPDQPGWLVEAGLAQRALGRRDSAMVFFAHARQADSTSYDVGYNWALETLAAGDTAHALDELRHLRDIAPDAWLTPLLTSRIARAHGDTLRANLAFDEARRLNPAMGLASAMRAGATAALPGWSSPELEAAEHLTESGEFGLAAAKFYQAGRDKDHRVAALYWLAKLQRISGAPTGMSVLAAEAGAEASNGDPIYIRALVEAQTAAGDTTRARANMNALRRGAPNDIVAAALAARADLTAGDPVAARAVFNEIAQAPSRSYLLESTRAMVFTATHDAGAAIARQRAAAADYLGQ